MRPEMLRSWLGGARLAVRIGRKPLFYIPRTLAEMGWYIIILAGTGNMKGRSSVCRTLAILTGTTR